MSVPSPRLTRIKRLRAIFARYARDTRLPLTNLRAKANGPGGGHLKSMYLGRKALADHLRRVRSYLRRPDDKRFNGPPSFRFPTEGELRISQLEDRWRRIQSPRSRAKLGRTISRLYRER